MKISRFLFFSFVIYNFVREDIGDGIWKQSKFLSSSTSSSPSFFLFAEAKATTNNKGGVGIGGYMGRALIDLIISLTQSRIQRSTDVSEQVQECLEEELPTSSHIWVDDQGIKAKESPENYISRIILDKHPDTCGFVACLLNRSLVSTFVMQQMTGKLLFVGASLIASTPDPAALFRGFLQNGVPLTYTTGMGNNPSLPSSSSSSSSSSSTDQFNLLHKILSRDKSMLGDVANRLLQPSNQQNSHYALYLSAVAESLILRIINESGRPAEEGSRIRNAVKSLVSNADIKPGSNTNNQLSRRNRKDTFLGRKISYSHIETLNNAMSQVLITTLITYLHQYNTTYTWSLIDDHPLGKLMNQQDKYGRNPFHVAVMTNNYAAIELLVTEIRSLEYQVQDRLRSLQLIPEDIVPNTRKLSTRFLQTILEQEDIFGYTPYTLAVTLGHSKAAQTLLNIHQDIGSTKGIMNNDTDSNENRHPELSSASSSSFVTGTLHRPYRRGKGKVYLYNDKNELTDITQTVSKSALPLFPHNSVTKDTNGGWEEPVYISPRLTEAVQASKQHALRNSSTSGATESSYGCDIDVIDFTCTYVTDKEACLQKVSMNQTLFAHDILKEFYIPNRPVLLRGLAKQWPVRTLWKYLNFLTRHGKNTMNSVDIPYAPVFGKKASDTVTVTQHVQALQTCTPAMVRGEEKLPYGLTSDICAMYVDDGRVPEEDESDSSNSIVSESSSKDKQESMDKKKKASLSPKPYLFYRLNPGEPFAVGLIDDMTLVPWFLNTKLPRVVQFSTANETDNENIGIQSNGEPIISSSSTQPTSSSLPLESLMMPLPQPPSPQFYLGGPGSGAPPHYHEDAWNVLAYGKKVWYITPPSAAEYMTVPIHDYVLEVLPKTKDKIHANDKMETQRSKDKNNSTITSFWGPNSRPLTCIQEAGDVIYVPHGWGHGVVNIETVIGYAVEFHSPFQRY